MDDGRKCRDPHFFVLNMYSEKCDDFDKVQRLFNEHLSFAPSLADFIAQFIVAVAEGFIEDHADLACIDYSVFP